MSYSAPRHDMPLDKFEAGCRVLGFNHVPQGCTYISHDGALHVPAVLVTGPFNANRINRRASFAAITQAFKRHNEGTPGADTPRAPIDQAQQGE